MNANVGGSNDALELSLRFWRRRQADVRVDGVHLRRSCAQERERHEVSPRIAALQMRTSVRVIRHERAMLVESRPVVVLRMIVMAVGVSVQQRRHAGRSHQRRDEQPGQDALHSVESMGRRRWTSKKDPVDDRRPAGSIQLRVRIAQWRTGAKGEPRVVLTLRNPRASSRGPGELSTCSSRNPNTSDSHVFTVRKRKLWPSRAEPPKAG
jgi:hypothetical protein